MRSSTLGLVAAASLLLASTGADAYAVSMTARGAVSSLTTSDTVTVDVFLDVDGGITFFSVAVVNSNPSALLYDGPASAALPLHPLNPGGADSSGAQPSYLLYTPRHFYLLPLQSPYFLTFPPAPGTEQVNITYFENGLSTTLATGTGIYVATLLFRVVAGFTSESLELAFTSSNLIQRGTFVVPPTTIGLSAPILLTGQVPEPTTATLIGLGLVGLCLAGVRRAPMAARVA